MTRLGQRITARLAAAPTAGFVAYAIAAAFATYFAMYALRKPFAAASYAGLTLGPLGLKSALAIGQLAGYALSKLIGVKVNSELPPGRRLAALLAIALTAELALLGFAVAPPGGQVVAMFLNGLPLGATWGVAFSFLEGRRTSELLGAGLSCSYVVASGAVKAIGAGFLHAGVAERWMPALVGACFLPLFAAAAWALSLLPPPSPADQAARTPRAPMAGAARAAFVARYGLGLGLLVVVYLFLTAYRDLRDNFAPELWRDLGQTGAPRVLFWSELLVAAPVMLGTALIVRVRGNRRALVAVYLLMIAGSVLVGVATLALDRGWIDGSTWMVSVGVGLYLAYVPYGCVLFDRLIAALGVVATAVFLIYVSDAVAYGGSVAVMLYKELARPELSTLEFFRGLSYATSGICAGAFGLSLVYFLRRSRGPGSEPEPEPEPGS